MNSIYYDQDNAFDGLNIHLYKPEFFLFLLARVITI